MLPRPLTINDLQQLGEIDGTIESRHYCHLNRSIDEVSINWRLERRPLRETIIEANRLSDELEFGYKQICAGIEEGIALCIEIGDTPQAALAGQPDPALKTLRLNDLRVDYDYRRQGLGMALLCAAIGHARDAGLRAVTAETLSHNDPAIQLLRKLSFEPAGLDAFRLSNHDLVKEKATLLWCLAID